MAVPRTLRLRNEVPRMVEEKLELLSGWKEIAKYLGKGVRTVQRYEGRHGLPVRRTTGKAGGSVLATKAELNGWVTASPIREAFRVLHCSVDNAPLLSEFRRHIDEMHRLREEMMHLRAAVTTLLESLQSHLRFAVPEQDDILKRSVGPRAIADVLAFDPMKKKLN